MGDHDWSIENQLYKSLNLLPGAIFIVLWDIGDHDWLTEKWKPKRQIFEPLISQPVDLQTYLEHSW